MMLGSKFTLMVVPDDTGQVFLKKLAGWKIVTVAAICTLLFLCTLGFTIAYMKATVDRNRLTSLKRENRYFAERLKQLQGTIEELKAQMGELVKKDENIRLAFDLPSIDASIREVGVGGPTPPTVDLYSPTLDQLMKAEADVDKMLRQIRLENASFADVYEKLQLRKDILDHTPSIMPVEGFVTRGLGMQQNPLTGFYQPHNGIDIAAERGTPVWAPAAGEVVFAGWEQGLGNTVIIDHGYGLRTCYGHLSLIKVREGAKVKRMDLVGLVGSTGNSTGPHLHYELRKNGIPVDPRQFALRSVLHTP